jgi:tetratricopeptide (TPR) repeat protein
VLWTTLLLVVLVAAGLRAGVVAWLYGLGIGVAVAVWLLLPRWRVAAPLVVVFVLVVAAQREVRRYEMAREPFADTLGPRQARLDKADWGLWRSGSLGRQLAGRGVGTFFVAYDHHRPLETFAARLGDGLIDHARRQLTEVLCERGIVGVLLALAAGAACVAAGVVCSRRARDSLDAALGAGLAAGAVAMGMFACFSNGAVGFGAGVAFWLGVGLLGALSSVHGREAGLSRSAEEDSWRAEGGSMRRPGRLVAALGLGVAAVALWFVLGARPFWAEVRLRDGIEEHKALNALIAHYKLLIDQRDRFSPNELQYIEARRKAKRQGGTSREAEQLKAKLPARVFARLEAFMESVQTGRANLLESAARTRDQLRRAAALSVGDRVWLTAQVNLLRYAIDRYAIDAGNREEVLEIGARLQDFCGPIFTLDLELARFHVAIGQFDEAHKHFRRYARKNPFAVSCALRRSTADVYGDWFLMIASRHRANDPRAAEWAEDLMAAADRGFRFDPTRYAFLARQGGMLYELGRTEEAYIHMLRASDIIEDKLAYPHSPIVQANLLVDAALLNFPWDPGQALGLAGRVFTLGIDFNNPDNRRTMNRALAIVRRIGPPPPMRDQGARDERRGALR